MARGHKGEDDQRDRASDRGDRGEVETNGEDDRDGGCDRRRLVLDLRTDVRAAEGTGPIDAICSQSPAARYSPELVAPAVANRAVTLISQQPARSSTGSAAGLIRYEPGPAPA